MTITDKFEETVRALIALPQENEWVEFKHNNDKPQEIGEYLSALANSAALLEKERAYMVWGVRDGDRELVGTSFDPYTRKVGNEDLIPWLTRGLDPQVHFEFFKGDLDGKAVVLLEINPANYRPVAFGGESYIRVGSYKKRLKDYHDHEERLWRRFTTIAFEKGVAKAESSAAEVLELLDFDSYFELMGIAKPKGSDEILKILASEGLITETLRGNWNVSNVGAVLFAWNLDNFESLKRKALRIIKYNGTGRDASTKEQIGQHGYAKGFEEAIKYLRDTLPSREVIETALRETVYMFPVPAVRELVANALIHQDFSETGTGPMVEIFDDRLEISNPGKPLIDPLRFVDIPPKSRNEILAGLMRRARICEERGSGWDRVAVEIELHMLPAPMIEISDRGTRVVVFGHRDLKDMDRQDRVRATYLHSVLKWVNREKTTNASIRGRFGLPDSEITKASRFLKEAVEDDWIRPRDPDAAPRYRDYIPFWATGSTTQS